MSVLFASLFFCICQFYTNRYCLTVDGVVISVPSGWQPLIYTLHDTRDEASTVPTVIRSIFFIVPFSAAWMPPDMRSP